MSKKIDIRCTSVSHSYISKRDSLVVLRDVSLEVERHRFYCIVGPSGCGKSTLLKVILKLINCSTGDVWLAPERKQRGVSYIPQSANLLPWRTVLQNGTLGLELKGNVSHASVQHVREELEKYNLSGFEDTMWSALSGGMKQKVAVICALASRPDILVCDEPFSSIDFVSRLQLLNRFKADCETRGVTTLFVTHNIEEAIFLGDQIAVMSRRPGTIISTYDGQLSKDAHDSVKCREAPEFDNLFRKIWSDLEKF